MEREYWLHYVGASLYKRSNFEFEASKYGVQRTIGFSLLGKLEFGTPILLAHYHGKVEMAEVFGYFIVNGLSHNLPLKVVEELYEQLDVVEVDKDPRNESRFCGSYTVGSTAIIRNTLQDLVLKIREVCEKHELDVNDYKWFVKGKYRPFDNNVILTPIKFTRGYMKVTVEDLDLESHPAKTQNLVWILDYKRKVYLSKKRKAALLSQKITNWTKEA